MGVTDHRLTVLLGRVKYGVHLISILIFGCAEEVYQQMETQGAFFYGMIPKITQNCGLCPPVLAHHLWLCCIRLVLLPHKLQVKAKPNVCLYSQKVREQIVLHSEIIFSKNCCLILAIK